jgi:SanA protein
MRLPTGGLLFFYTIKHFCFNKFSDERLIELCCSTKFEPMRFKRLFLRLFILSFALVLISGGLVALAAYKVGKASSGKTYGSIDQLPDRKAGLLLGTSKFLASGLVNIYWSNRINAADSLLKQGKIRYLVISGDNSIKSYNEPRDMKDELVARGNDSTRIFLDYAGFRTLDSVVRLKKIFGQESAIVISQRFHNERAIYLADNYGITLVGYNARDVSKRYGRWMKVRETLARTKAMLDLWIGTEPKFLGEMVPVPE